MVYCIDEKRIVINSEIISDYQAGLSSTVLAKKYGKSPTTILKIVKEAGILVKSTTEKTVLSEQDQQDIYDKYIAGQSSEILALEYHTAQKNITQFLRSRGLDVRKRATRSVAHHDGYVYSHVEPNHPYFCMAHKKENGWGAYILQHRFVMAEHLGRPLTKQETVHHINGNRKDNRIENLELWSSRHPRGQRIFDQAVDIINQLSIQEQEQILQLLQKKLEEPSILP